MNLILGEVQTFVSDLAGAKVFYADTLGLNLVGESERWLVFDVSGVEFIVMGGAQPGGPKGAYGMECATVLCLKSCDIEHDYEALKDKGVLFFSGVTEVPQGKFVAFQDPEGNLLELIQK